MIQANNDYKSEMTIMKSSEGKTYHAAYFTQYSSVQYSTVQYSTVQYSTVQYSTVQYSTVQYSVALCRAILHQVIVIGSNGQDGQERGCSQAS